MIEKLSLSSEQRKKMDEAYAAFEKRLQDRAKAGAARSSFQAALEAGRFDDARKDLKAISETAGVPAEAMGELKIATLEQLTDDQRATLKEEYPMLVRQQWSPRPSWASRRRPQGQRPARPGGGPGPS